MSTTIIELQFLLYYVINRITLIKSLRNKQRIFPTTCLFDVCEVSIRISILNVYGLPKSQNEKGSLRQQQPIGKAKLRARRARAD